MASGAEKPDVLKLVVGHGFNLALVGATFGTIASLLLMRFLSSLLFEITPTDPATFIVVGLILTLVALLASYIPAHRASRIDPLIALRFE